jgi:hypothetical protein
VLIGNGGELLGGASPMGGTANGGSGGASKGGTAGTSGPAGSAGTANGGTNAGGTNASGGINAAGSNAGGTNTGGTASGGAASGGTAAGGTAAGGTAAGGKSSGGGTGGNLCTSLATAVNTARAAAIACNPNAARLTCTGTVEDQCGCKVVVDDPDSAEADAYRDALAKFKDNKCSAVCTQLICPNPNKGSCQQSGDSFVCVGVLSGGTGPGSGG